MSKNSDYRDSDEWKTLNILYDMGLLDDSGRKRFTFKKEMIFVEIMKNPDISNQSIASKLFITVDTVKTFSSEIYREISITIGEKITRQTMKSAIKCFLDKSPSSNDFVGVLISSKSIKESLHISLKNLIKSFLEQGLSQDNICEQFNHIMNNIEDIDISIK